jgi:hypothetical protein
VAAGAIAVLLAAHAVRVWYRALTTQRFLRASKQQRVPEVNEAAKRSWIESAFVSFTAIMAFCFEILLVYSIESVFCQEQNGAFRLASELDQVSLCLPLSVPLSSHVLQVCFNAVHTPVFIVAILLILYLGLAYPAIALYGARQIRLGRTPSTFVRVVAVKLMDEFKDEVWWFGAMGLLLVRFCSLFAAPLSQPLF